jgi:2,4-dienoyl-CoA reductase-like NADH-dependent reductase (Old Yellow Enzyme family)
MLDRPLALPCGATLPNRLAKSAMTEALATPLDEPSPELVALYRRFARSGAGLLITGNVGIDRDHLVRPGDVVLDGRSPAAPFRAWARAAREGGARVVVQLNHAGRQTPRFVNPRPLAPSAVPAVKALKAFGRPRAMTPAEIESIEARFVAAARAVEAAGFDGVQIHAAHGYLLSQFLSPLVNRRDDAWGGPVAGRARLLLRIVRAVRERAAPGFIVSVKLNASDFQRGGFTEDESLEVVRLLGAESIDLLEISGGSYESPASFGVTADAPLPREAYFLSFARRARALTRAPLLLTGGMRTRAAMAAAIAEGSADLVGLARPLLIDPELPAKLIRGEAAEAPRRSGWGPFAGLAPAAEMAWYSAQLWRLGRGEAPDPSLGPYAALAMQLMRDTRHARDRRRALAAAPAAPALLASGAAPSA